jgi:hypothetical protein
MGAARMGRRTAGPGKEPDAAVVAGAAAPSPGAFARARPASQMKPRG